MRFLFNLCLIISVALAPGIQIQLSHAVDYTVTNTGGTVGSVQFSLTMGDDDTVQTLMASITNFILETIFQQTDPADINQDVQQITLVVEEMNDVSVMAYGINNYEIHLNSGYIRAFSGDDLQIDITATLYHEITHAWQWIGTGNMNGNGNINPGLFEGIADYVTLKAGYTRSYWGAPGEGERWDQGNEVTAYFLDYCNSLREGFVADLNSLMRDYYDDYYFFYLLGKEVKDLWNDYKSPDVGCLSGCVIS